MDDKIKKAYIWSIIYLLLEFLVIYIFKFILSDKFLYIGIIGIIYILINLFFIKYKRERLFINGILSFITVIFIGILLGNDLALEEIIGIGVAISIVDVLSFTKYGKNTLNAKAMSNINFMSKLIVYGKGKKDKLYPTCGIGDYLYFSLWISGLSKNVSIFIFFCIAILVGNLINNFIVYKLHNNKNYKGIPATIIPFICIMISYLIIVLLK